MPRTPRDAILEPPPCPIPISKCCFSFRSVWPSSSCSGCCGSWRNKSGGVSTVMRQSLPRWQKPTDRCPVAKLRLCAAQAQSFSLRLNKATKVHALTALRADDPLSPVSWQLRYINGHPHQLFIKKLTIREFAIRQHRLMFLALDVRIEPLRHFSRFFQRHHPNPQPRCQIQKRSRDLAPVAEFQRPLTQPAPGHYPDCIRCAAVDLDKRHQPLAIECSGPRVSRRRADLLIRLAHRRRSRSFRLILRVFHQHGRSRNNIETLRVFPGRMKRRSQRFALPLCLPAGAVRPILYIE